MALQLLQTKNRVGKAPNYIIALNGKPLSSHRTLTAARKKFESLKRKANK